MPRTLSGLSTGNFDDVTTSSLHAAEVRTDAINTSSSSKVACNNLDLRNPSNLLVYTTEGAAPSGSLYIGADNVIKYKP